MKKDQNGYWQQNRAYVAITRNGAPILYTVSSIAANCRQKAEDAFGLPWKKITSLHGLKTKKCSLQIDVWE